MSDDDDPGGGVKPPGPPLSTSQQSKTSPGQVLRTHPWAGAGGLGGTHTNLRSFSEIIAEEKSKRNIIEIKLTKIASKDTNGDIQKPKHLSFDDLAILIFDVLQINPDQCLTFD